MDHCSCGSYHWLHIRCGGASLQLLTRANTSPGSVNIMRYGAGPNGVMRTLGQYMLGSGATFGYAVPFLHGRFFIDKYKILHVHWKHHPHRYNITTSHRSIRSFTKKTNHHAPPAIPATTECLDVVDIQGRKKKRKVAMHLAPRR